MEGASPSGHSAGCGVSDAPPRELTGGPGGAKDAWRHLGMYFSKLKEYTPRPPKKNSGGISNFPPDDPLETTKGRAVALPLETFPGVTGDFGETGAGTSPRAYGGR